MIAFDVAEGHRNGEPLALQVLARATEALGRLDGVLADKAFNSDEIHGEILEGHDALPVIPNRRNRANPCPWDDMMRVTYKEQDDARARQGEAVSEGRHPL